MVMMMMGPNGQWQSVSASDSGAVAQMLQSAVGGSPNGHSMAANFGDFDAGEEMVSTNPKQSVVTWDQQHYRNL